MVAITDRVVLDCQLQETIYRFTPTVLWRRSTRTRPSWPQRLMGERARIIITTLQKFPFVMRHVEELKQRTYAVIIDEAHSSQTGYAAKEI